MITYKKDVLAALKDRGFTTYRLRKDKLLSESTVQALRRGDLVALDNINRACAMLDCQPGDLLQFSREAGDLPNSPKGIKNNGDSFSVLEKEKQFCGEVK